MSNPRLPVEILDHIVDHLRDEKDTLRNCCLVSKSWIPRTRRHIFAHIKFRTPVSLQSWKETFPDPSTSPGRYAKALFVGCSHIVTAADAEAGGWISGFSRASRLRVGTRRGAHVDESAISLIPFHGFSPVIKTLRATFVILPSLQVFNLILSFPLLEDLTVIAFQNSVDNDDGPDGLPPAQPPSSPLFTGSLTLALRGRGIKPIARRLLSLPGGIHFRKLTLMWYHEEDLPLTMALVEECAHTLESLNITYTFYFGSVSASVDLSRATRLKDVVFRVKAQNVEWITMALQTVTPEHRDLRQISIYVFYYQTFTRVGADVRRAVGEQIFGQWLELDRLLVQLWESRSIRPRVTSMIQKEKQRARYCIGCLLPEITKREIIDLAI